MSNINTVNDILPGTMKKMGLDREYKIRSVIWRWREIVGKEISKHTAPILIHNGILLVAAKNSVWCHHLSMLRESLLAKVNSFIGSRIINDIKFKVGNINAVLEDNAKQSEYQIVSIPLDDIEKEYANEFVAHITDSQLKNRILSVITKELSRKKFLRKENWPKCGKCGVYIKPDEKLCTVCSYENKHDRLSVIRRYLLEMPWLSFEELYKYYACTEVEFKRAKNELLDILSREVYAGGNDRVKEMTLVMLITRIPPFNLTSDLISQTMQKIRGKKYVSASRS